MTATMRGYLEPAVLPDDRVSSIRCFVIVGEQVVVCTNADGLKHAWPGGRREAGETHAQTAVREVEEETGWYLEPASLVELGWLRFELNPPPAEFCHLVFVGRATTRAAEEWTDTEGYEISSQLATAAEAATLLATEPVCLAFLPLALEAAGVAT